MDGKPLPPGLHVILGDHAADTFDEAFAARESLLIDRDVLCCGPTRRCNSLDEWQAMRHQYWTGLLPMATEQPLTDRGFLDDMARLRDAPRLTIWAATSLSEQLFIAHALHRADAVSLDPARIHVVQFEKFPDRHTRVLGLGELDPEQLRRHPAPRPLSREELGDYRDAWAALVSDDPASLDDFSRTHASASPWLKGALQLMLRRYPDCQSGLPHWDRELLAAVKQYAPRAARAIGYTLTREWGDADLTGDWYLYGRMLGMSRLPQPLLEFTSDLGDMRAAEVRLTPFGLDVLEGRESNYPTNPIEDWAAGVRLSSREGALWFNDAGRLVRG